LRIPTLAQSMPRLLLLSNSANPGQGYLEHARRALADFLGPSPLRLAFAPFAAIRFSYDDYTARVREVFGAMGHAVDSLHEGDPADVLRQANGIVVGGGNTFRLLERLSRLALLDRIRRRGADGMPYVGWSAGANLACPTIRTTNDMPVIEPPSLTALGLVPFQINPHYTDLVVPNHGGETRAERIAEFLELNPAVPVIGLREGSMLRVEGRSVTLLGPHPLRLFQAGLPARDLPPGPVGALAVRKLQAKGS
jgi:dipeptidase E